ncbi:MAG: cellulase family glycosylhydrolase [Bacteroidetes bacterium]|nr:cellulase family glycosylhydrolase [Bacteroidota bacterium]
MRKFQIILVFIILSATSIIAQNTPFSKGVGFAQAFEANSPTDIHFNYYTRQDFINVKKLGINQVRLPINMANMFVDEINYQLDPLFLYLLDQYVDIAEEEGINLIITNMSGFDYNNDTSVRDKFINIWTQIAQHYKDRPSNIFYELANEPGYNVVKDWGVLQGELIDTIRSIDQTHTIIVTPAWGGIKHLYDLPNYEDDNLIYTFHFYHPFLFTHQGAHHVSLDELQGVPFPYDPELMPEMPSSYIGSQYEIDYNNYVNEGTAKSMQDLVESAATFKKQRNVPLWCGEFGADDKYSNPDDRVYWYEVLRTSLEENGISWSMHGYTRYWGLFEYGTYKLFDYDLNIPLVEAMGLNTQAQSEFVVKPETSEFDIYNDYATQFIYTWVSTEEKNYNFYCEEDTYEGKFCINIEDLPIWACIDFRFEPYRDLSNLIANDYVLEFRVKGDTPGAKFNVRFIDTDTDDPEDHPWRIVHDIDETMASWDGNWHLIQIPLSDFVEQGAWDEGEWYDPEGKFDWKAIWNFQITTEYHSFEGMKFWFDDIRIAERQELETTNLTFQVDMQNETVSQQGVFLRGSFNNWNSTEPIEANGSIYSKTIELTAGEIVEYKFVNGDQWEEAIPDDCIINNNRYIVVPETNTSLEAVCFNSCSACNTTAVEKLLSNNIQIFPNPTDYKIYISGLAEDNLMIRVFSTDGRLILEKSKNQLGIEQIDISNFNLGIYYLNIVGDKSSHTYKIIKE